jgi:predicted RNA-binding Zn-ribbon protein involved in translation (DUF1610 family)
MGFTVEQDCPQCGAPIELDETDHLMLCPYCHVKSFLYAPDYFRFVLPHKAPDEEIIYAPFLRFKGNVYFCTDQMVGHRIVDITRVGVDLKGLPGTLGFRPQTMKMKFVNPDTAGSFLRFTLKASDILAKAGKLSSGSSSDPILHRAFIGETLSLIYLPLYVNANTLFDAVLNRPIGKLSEGAETFESAINRNPRWKLSFMATLCPQCGWNLEGERDSVVLTCGNCETAWEASKGKFIRVIYFEVPGHAEGSRYLPFWKISVRGEGVEINSFADFIRLTNQPRVLGKEWENEEMSFWSPAFKIRPKIFLNLSRQFTISQDHLQTEEEIPKKHLYPVTLPRSEAIQAMKVILANSTLTKNNVFPYLPAIKFDINDSALVYLPFKESGHEMIQEQMQISINKNTLEFGRQL